jgi:diadenosine tetraphosphate (Ap4A) HIT family hydrolase
MFELHERLVRATAPLGDLPLSRVLLLDDHRHPWLLLVPRRDGIEEIYELSREDRTQLMEEITAASLVLKRLYEPFRLNIADIGNKAYQLHIHVTARFETDPHWPDVVWSREREPYAPAALAARQAELRAAFAQVPGFTTGG